MGGRIRRDTARPPDPPHIKEGSERMPPVLGNAIAILAVAALVSVCVRYLWMDHKRGGGCASCGSNGGCASCGGCAHGGAGCAGSVPEGFRPIDISALKIDPNKGGGE